MADRGIVVIQCRRSSQRRRKRRSRSANLGTSGYGDPGRRKTDQTPPEERILADLWNHSCSICYDCCTIKERNS